MIPDFYVVGAQKSGTTALCSIMSKHPDVFISTPKEPMFLSRDDPMIHPNFFIERQSEWLNFDWERCRKDLLQRYDRLFETAGENQLCGEGSTTYMLSREAPARIYSLNPDARIIFLLRNPVNRAYSAYWHYVREGLAIWSFQKEIQFNADRILAAGCYKRYIERYLNIFPREQIFIGLTEEFETDQLGFTKEVFKFLDLDTRNDIEMNEKRNTAQVPASLSLHLFLNYMYKIVGAQFSAEDQRDVAQAKELSNFQRKLIHLISLIQKKNLKNKRYAPMNSRIRYALTEYYRRENLGLANLIGINLEKYWEMPL